MSSKIIEIVICLGSSCFARGNKKTMQIIQQFIKDNELEDKVNFKGNHCFGKCHNGPVIKVNDNFYEGIGDHDIIDILENELSTLKK
jgi:NADH:ubiquinone oxidoreductase subunit E